MATTAAGPTVGAAPPTARRRRVARAGAVVAAATALAWLAAAASAWVTTRHVRDPLVRELVIPPGTAGRVEAGANPLEIPPTFDFVVGDTLRLVNHDTVAHSLGPWRVGPGATRTIRFRSAVSGSLACSLHPSGRLAVEVRARQADLTAALVPAAVFGPLLGGVALGVAALARRLGPD
jgi:hypothetical protein